MPNIDNLIDTIQQNLNTNASHETAHLSTLDLKYAYSLPNLDPETARHCNFNIISGEQGCSAQRSAKLYPSKRPPTMQGGEHLSFLLLEGPTCEVRLRLRRRTCGNTTLNSGRCSIKSPPQPPWQLGYDYTWAVCVLAIHASRDP